MDDINALIDQITGEHAQIIPDVKNLNRMANDPQAILALEKTKEAFVPARPDTQREGLQKLRADLCLLWEVNL